jgi:AhpD family alkylhydroperoxidase
LATETVPHTEPVPHPDIRGGAPEAYRALAALTRGAPDIDHGLAELVKVRVSQINGCAYCIDLHAGIAAKAGVSDRKLYSVIAWREAPFYSDEERAALRLAEALTLLPSGPPEGDAFVEAATRFPGTLLAQLVIVITGINAWNRVMIASGATPPDET